MLTGRRYDGHDALAAAGSTAPGERLARPSGALRRAGDVQRSTRLIGERHGDEAGLE